MSRPPADRTVQDADAHRDGKITRDVVLTTALEIIDRAGAEGLSMRRLARALDRDPMILYRHAPNKAALLDGVAETVLAQLKVDPPTPTGTARCAPSPATTARWRWRTRTWYRCWSPAPGHTARAAPPKHPAPARRRSRPAHPRRLQRRRRAAHLPGTVRLPARACAQRTARTRRQPGRNRRPAAAWPAPAANRRIPRASQPGPRPSRLRRRRRTRTRPRHPPYRTGHHAAPARRGAILQPGSAWAHGHQGHARGRGQPEADRGLTCGGRPPDVDRTDSRVATWCGGWPGRFGHR